MVAKTNCGDRGSEQLALPPLAHVGIVVSDLASAAADFERRWGARVMDVAELTLSQVSYAARPADISIRHGFIRHGASDIELIEPLSDWSPYADFLKTHRGDGVHHLAYVVDDIDRYLARLRPAPAEVTLDGYLPNAAVRFVHVDGFAHGPTVELIEQAPLPVEDDRTANG
jgi:methylmalonyl-CoA/ethylmalonyl-CoA epimerase